MEAFAIVLLIVLIGLFAMSEIAVVSARPTRQRQWVKQGDEKAAALALRGRPNEFLSTIQIGITLIGVLAGAVGEAVIADDIADDLVGIPALARYADGIALAIVVVAITYLSLVVGELVPKRLALLRAEPIARTVAQPMSVLARAMRPTVHLLSLSVEAVLRLLRVRVAAEPPVTEEEIQSLIEEGTRAGIFLRAEQDLLKNVMRLADRSLSMLMTPRTDIAWLDLDRTLEENLGTLRTHPHTLYPVARGSLERIEGVVQAKDLLAQSLNGRLDFAAIMRPALQVPLSASPLRVLEMFKTSPVHMAHVIGAAGELKGLVTVHDMLEAMVGALPTEREQAEPMAVQRPDGSWLLDGLLGVQELKEALGVGMLPGEETDAYRTLSGFILAHLGRVPGVGDRFAWGGWQFEVVDMDGKRIDRALVTPRRKAARRGARES